MLCMSCDKFLDVEPIGKIIPKSYNEYRALITDAYNSEITDRSYSALLSDESKFVSDETSYIQFYKDTFIWNVASPDANIQQLPWQKFYKIIFYANHIIKDTATIIDGTPDQVNQLVGEAFLLRAYMYFNLVNLYADHYGLSDPNTQRGIPLSFLDIDLEKRNKPNTVAEVYKQILSDLSEGTALLTVAEQPKGYNYRFSKISAYGLAARVYLYMGDFVKAEEFAQKALAINGKLEDLNSATAIMPYKFKSVESILAFEKTFTFDNSSSLVVSSSLVALYNKDKDLRLTAFYRLSYGDYKVKLGGGDDAKLGMRTAEFYLIVAEATARSNGDLAKAKDALKTLLKSRLKPDYYTQRAVEIDAMGKEAFVQAVFDERTRELAFQGFRWFDLKRNGKPEIVKTFDGQTYTLKQNDPRYVIRFPKDAVANNPYLAE
jgi:tetratricopeptide (TPR) repeat protein